MKLRRKKAFAPEVFTSSLNDIMFFLMLFFLIISTMVNPNVIKLLLPKATAAQKQKQQNESVTVAVDAQKAYYINREPVAKEAFEETLKTVMNAREDRSVILQVDNSVSVQDLVDVLQIGAKLDVKMVMAVKK